MNIIDRYTAFILVMLIAIGVQSCEDSLNPNPNVPPETTLTNIPAENDTVFSLVTLSWDGGDDDGFVEAYEYRYTTHHLNQGDSVVKDWQRTENSSETIAFNSSDQMNRQVFKVRAIDNEGEHDPEPAKRVFYTPKSFPPEITLEAPADGSEFFFKEQTTDWWTGIRIDYSASVNQGVIEEYAYSVDGNPLVWTTDTTALITPDQFEKPLSGEHTIRVTARNNTGLINPKGDSINITLVEPDFDREILVIDETDENNWGINIDSTDQQVDAFYRTIFSGEDMPEFDMWDYTEHEGLPTLQELGRYKLIVWYADNKPSNAAHSIAEDQNISTIRDYLNVGGNLMFSGWRILKSFAWNESFPKTFEQGTFLREYAEIATVDETPILAKFNRANSVNNFPGVKVDSTKLDFFPNQGTLNNINVITERGGFSKIIHSYGTVRDSQYPQYRGSTVGMMYYGTSFNIGILGYPLYFTNREDASALIHKMIKEFGISSQ